jgi:hypothetical protein
MPQLDIDLFDDFLFFAFVSLLFGVADDESEEAVVEMHGEIALVQGFLAQKKQYEEQTHIVKGLFTSSVLSKK